ncbi:MAG TPA: M56 family metallopeptidase, partial [Planctomycetaceae bacterium]|nr:M56 family metallopeptidase [Planctomycetaceae bacterium]
AADNSHVVPDSSPHITLNAAWDSIRPILRWTWLGGVLIVALIAGIRIVRFQRMLTGTLLASKRLQSITDELARRMDLRKSPEVRVVESAAAPLVWYFGRRATVVLPLRLLNALDEHQLSLVLAHELSHLRRRDHWVRVIELTVSVLYWWNPLAWWVRRRLHAVEEQCCDAWVSWIYPDRNRDYAESLLKAAELLPSHSPFPVLASPFLNAPTLKERIEMVLTNRSQRMASRGATLWLLVLAAAVIPVGLGGILQGEEHAEAGLPKADPQVPVTNVSVKQAVRETPTAATTSTADSKLNDRSDEIDAAIARLRKLGAFVREFHPRDNPDYWVQIISDGLDPLSGVPATNFDDAAMEDVELIGRGVAVHLHLRETSITSTGLKRLASAGRIEMLELNGPNIDDEMLKILPTLPLQGHLDLNSDLLSDKGIQIVAKCRELTGIGLTGRSLTDACLEPLTGLPKLQGVTLGETFSRAAFETLSRIEGLTNLDISAVTPELSDLKKVPKLQRLSLSGKKYDDDAALVIAETFTSLEQAYLRGTSITNAGVEHLSRLKTLKVLTLDNSRIDDGVADSIRKMKQLTWLSVNHCAVGDETLAAVSECPGIWFLSFNQTSITDTGVAHLIKLQRPLTLNLVRCKGVTDASVDSLALLPDAVGTNFQLNDSSITQKRARELQAMLPHAQISWGIPPVPLKD